MSKLSYNKTRTISYTRKVSKLTGEVFWEPIWELSDQPPMCSNCVKHNTAYCKKESAPPWFGADCANWLPQDVKFEEVNRIVCQCINDLFKLSNRVWSPGYSGPVVGLACRLASCLEYYLENPLTDLRGNDLTKEEKERRKYFGYIKK